MTWRAPLILSFLILSACNRAPSRGEALEVLRVANPALDTTTAVRRVWADGPPWFSCAEVIAKFRAKSDTAVVRDQVGNWRSLVLADWVSLRDTVAGSVVEPGWCEARLRDEPARLADGWRPVLGDSLPNEARRRGWDVLAGRQRISVNESPRTIGKDSALVHYLLTIAANTNGAAIGVARDSTRHRAILRRENGRWRVLEAEWSIQTAAVASAALHGCQPDRYSLVNH